MKNVEVYLAILAFYLFFKILFIALDDVAQWFEHRPVNQRVAGSILSQDTCLGCGPVWGHVKGNHTLMFLYLSFSLPSPLSKNK